MNGQTILNGMPIGKSKMKTSDLARTKVVVEFPSDFETLPFADYKDVPRKSGIYIIWQGDICIYVGFSKSDMRARFAPHHYLKAYGLAEESASTTDPVGWKKARENSWWNPEEFTIEYKVIREECADKWNFSEGGKRRLEGVLLLLEQIAIANLKPLANTQ